MLTAASLVCQCKTSDAVLVTFIGGVGTVHGPVLGAALFVFLREYLALRRVDLHLLIFGVLRRRPTARWAAMCRTRPDPREPPRIPHFRGNPCHVRGDRA